MIEYDKDELFQWHYGETKEEADRIAAEILDGKRTAIIQNFALDIPDLPSDEALRYYSNDKLQELLTEYRDMYPKPGDINILTNWDGVPMCVIRTKGFGLMHFGDIPLEVAELECGDTDLEEWQIRKSDELLEVLPEEDVHSKTILSIEIIEVLEKLYSH
ncbi:MAG: ASCH domain-containing protein [Clostridiales bacterium]|nr:ASCH domain-containing protein [Clostridiales bacterium]